MPAGTPKRAPARGETQEIPKPTPWIRIMKNKRISVGARRQFACDREWRLSTTLPLSFTISARGISTDPFTILAFPRLPSPLSLRPHTQDHRQPAAREPDG